MPITKITDLLPIPPGTRKPHAYQIFALEDGEQDQATINKAIKSTIARLKAAKDSTDEQLWKKAALLAQQARQTLVDPEKKAQLDARFGIIAIDDAEPQPESTPPAAADPLAAVLPPADPLAGVLPPSDPLEPLPPPPSAGPTNPEPTAGVEEGVHQSPRTVAGTHGSESMTDSSVQPLAAPAASEAPSPIPGDMFGAASPQSASDASVATPVMVTPKKPVRRRKRSAMSIVVFALFGIGMTGLVCLLGYVVLSEGQLAITSSDEGITISTRRAAEPSTPQAGPAVPVDQQRRSTRPHDPVMGDLAGDMPPPRRPSEPSGLVSGIDADKPMEDPFGAYAIYDDDRVDAPQNEPETPLEAAVAPPMEAAMEAPAEQPMTDPVSESETQPVTDQMIAAADQQLERVEALIREANWAEMKSAADSARDLPMNDQQQARAQALYELAEIAAYYRGGIERAIADQQAGSEIVVNEVRLIVVETGDDLLVVKLNGRNRSYKFDDIPFSLAHQLARFQIAESPTAQAAKAAYQAIVPKATPAHRAQAIDWLGEITEPVEGAEPQRMADTIKALFDAADD